MGITLTPWRKTISDGLDDMLKLEKDWAERGVDPDVLKDNRFLALGAMGAYTRVEFTY